MATASKPAATANDDQISASRVDGLALCGCELGRRGYEKSGTWTSDAISGGRVGRIDRRQALLPEGSSYLISHCLRLRQTATLGAHDPPRSQRTQQDSQRNERPAGQKKRADEGLRTISDWHVR